MRSSSEPLRDRRIRALPGRLLAATCAILLLALVAGATHHHALPDGLHPCAACTLSHAPAVESDFSDPGPALRPLLSLATPPAAEPCTGRVEAHGTRGPPVA